MATMEQPPDVNKTVPKTEVSRLIKMIDNHDFILKLQTHENIWNHRLPDHHRKAKDEYRKLATEMSSTIQLCKSKYSNLRTYFVKEHKKTESSLASGGGTNETYISKWAYYNDLVFLTATVDATAGSGSVIGDDQEGTEQCSDAESSYSASSQASSSAMMARPSSAPPSTPVSEPDQQQRGRKRRGRKRRGEDVQSVTQKAMGDVSTTLKALIQQRSELKTVDQYDHFGSMVAAQLRAMPTAFMRSNAMLKIHELLNMVAFGNQAQSTMLSPPTSTMQPPPTPTMQTPPPRQVVVYLQ